MAVELVIFKVVVFVFFVINIFLVQILIIIVLSLFSLFSSGLFGIIDFFFGGFFSRSASFNNGFGFSKSGVDIIVDQEVVKDGTGFDLPEIETDGSPGVVGVQFSVFFVFWVGNHWVNPWSFVVWVGDFFWLSIH